MFETDEEKPVYTKIGSNDASKICIGSNEVTSAYLGENKIYG